MVALGASAGGLEALGAILAGLPAGFGATVVVAQHLAPQYVSILPMLLSKRTPLRVEAAMDGADLYAGVVYVARPDRHLELIAGGRLRETEAPPVHFCRPSVDVLFRSVACACGASAVGVLLTGTGVDGAAGLLAIREAGGTTIAQDRATSQHFGMPGEAIRVGAAALVLPLAEIAPALCRIVESEQ